MAISAKELPKNHTDKEWFAAASSCIATEILTLLFARKRRRSTGPVLYQPSRSRSRRVPDLKVPFVIRNNAFVDTLLISVISVHSLFRKEEGTLFPLNTTQVGHTRRRLDNSKVLKTQSTLCVTHLGLSDM